MTLDADTTVSFADATLSLQNLVASSADTLTSQSGVAQLDMTLFVTPTSIDGITASLPGTGTITLSDDLYDDDPAIVTDDLDAQGISAFTTIDAGQLVSMLDGLSGFLSGFGGSSAFDAPIVLSDGVNARDLLDLGALFGT